MFHIKDTLCKTFAMLGEAKLFKNELEAKETGDIQDPLCLEDPSRSVVVFKWLILKHKKNLKKGARYLVWTSSKFSGSEPEGHMFSSNWDKAF